MDLLHISGTCLAFPEARIKVREGSHLAWIDQLTQWSLQGKCSDLIAQPHSSAVGSLPKGKQLDRLPIDNTLSKYSLLSYVICSCLIASLNACVHGRVCYFVEKLVASATIRRTVILITNSIRIYIIHFLSVGTISCGLLRWKMQVQITFENRIQKLFCHFIPRSCQPLAWTGICWNGDSMSTLLRRLPGSCF